MYPSDACAVFCYCHASIEPDMRQQMDSYCARKDSRMPTYNFVCPTCGTRFEERLSFQDTAKSVNCPHGHAGARRLFSAPVVVFKGSGFYVTDHRKKQTKESAGD
jgi:putative FmdB family regulatory protein